MAAQEITGTWNGMLDVYGTQLRIIINVTEKDGLLTSTMDSPDQTGNVIPVTNTFYDSSHIKLEIQSAGIVYKGELIGNEIIGTFQQRGQEFPLNLSNEAVVLKEKVRPQEPKKPYPYYSEDVEFMNEEANVSLVGTLTLPRKEALHPVVIIISGSGPQDRDGEMFDHKPYLVIADHLTKNGIGVLRFDERGIGDSGGDWGTATIEDFSNDIISAIKYLKSRKEINSSKIGLVGHSIGGIVAPKVASENKDVSYIVLLAGPGIDGDKLMLSQKAASERLMNFNEAQIAQGQVFLKDAYDIIVNSELENGMLKDSINSFYTNKYGNLLPSEQRQAIANQITGYEFVSLIKSKPSMYLSKVNCPVLAINGSKDFQVPAKENLTAIKKSVLEGGNSNVKTVELENMNHLFQECETGALNEYSEIEQTVSPIALELITNWITEQIK